MLTPDRIPDIATVAVTGVTTVAAAVFASQDAVGTGLVIGSAGVLGLMFRYWFAENKRNTAETWNHADEYRIERDYYRALADHWQARWVALMQGHDIDAESVALPDLETMKAEARSEKEGRRGRRQ